jgi:4-hydroxybenzoate polyprenyltransferase
MTQTQTKADQRPDDWTAGTRAIKLQPLSKLFVNHIDAWGVALIISTLAIVIHGAVGLQAIPILIAIAASYWLGFAYNDYIDAPFDAIDEEKGRRNFFVANHIPGVWVILGMAAVGGLLAIGAWILFGLKGILIVAVSLVIIWAYSGRPLRLKSRVGFDLLIHTFFVETYPYLVTLTLLGIAWTRLDYALILLFFFGSLTAQLEQQLVDYELDAKTEPNFTTWLGSGRAMGLLRVMTLIMTLLALVFAVEGTIPPYLVPFGLIAFPMLAHRFVRGPNRHKPRPLTLVTVAASILYAGALFLLL